MGKKKIRHKCNACDGSSSWCDANNAAPQEFGDSDAIIHIHALLRQSIQNNVKWHCKDTCNVDITLLQKVLMAKWFYDFRPISLLLVLLNCIGNAVMAKVEHVLEDMGH